MINTSVFKLLIPLHKKTVNTDLRFSAIYGNQLLLITYYISTTQPYCQADKKSAAQSRALCGADMNFA
ncbi:MAG TPA: hypothetical protein DGG22_04060 [Ruminococcaceae bacterium]|nr:hypothetical protein [Oscillospiraceae bacterium]